VTARGASHSRTARRSDPRREAAPSSASASGPGVDAGERWATGRGDDGRVYIADVRRAAIADFGLGGQVPSDVAHERAQLAAQAPLMYEALLDLISGMRDDGSIVELDGAPYEGHGAGCGCGICSGVLALALAEGGGRCILCGCTDDDACGSGCVWVDGAHFLCSNHSEPALKKGERFLARGGRRG
jgi:hypothetical protein